MSMSITSLLGNQSGSPAQQILQGQNGESNAKSMTDVMQDTQAKGDEVREAFQEFVGKTFYGQLLKSMRKSVGQSAYFHGGKGEEIFRSQLDQLVVEGITEKSGASLSDSLYNLSALSQRR